MTNFSKLIDKLNTFASVDGTSGPHPLGKRYEEYANGYSYLITYINSKESKPMEKKIIASSFGDAEDKFYNGMPPSRKREIISIKKIN